jgi:hypothetical protein
VEEGGFGLAGKGVGSLAITWNKTNARKGKDGARARGPMADHHDATAPERPDQMGHHRPLARTSSCSWASQSQSHAKTTATC